MRLLVCGDRNFTDREYLERIISSLKPSVIIEGGASGADKIAKDIAESLGIPVEEYKAEWDKYGSPAGPLRNKRMIEEGKPDMVLAVHYDLPHSKGTKNLVCYAVACNIQTLILTGKDTWQWMTSKSKEI